MIFSQIGCTINWVRHYDTNTGDTIFFYHYSTGFYTFNAFSFAYLKNIHLNDQSVSHSSYTIVIRWKMFCIIWLVDLYNDQNLLFWWPCLVRMYFILTFSFNAYLTTSVCTTSLCDNADQNLFVLEIVAIDFADLLFWWQYAKFEIKLFYYKRNSLMLYVLKGKLISCLDKIAIGKFWWLGGHQHNYWYSILVLI